MIKLWIAALVFVALLGALPLGVLGQDGGGGEFCPVPPISSGK